MTVNMQDLTKAQITIGMLAFFATVWSIVKYAFDSTDIPFVILAIIIQFIVMMILSLVILAILQWINIFELKVNAILTLITLVTIPMLALAV